MFEPMPPLPRYHRKRPGRFAQAIAVAAQQQAKKAEAKEEAENAQKSEKRRLEIEEEIKRRLASDSDEEYEGNYRDHTWEVRQPDAGEEEEKSRWRNVLPRLRKSLQRKWEWEVMCVTSVLSAMIVVFLFWMEWL